MKRNPHASSSPGRPARSRLLVACALVALTALSGCLSAGAQSSSDSWSQQPMPPRGSVWTVHTSVEAQVLENYAVVHVRADIGNRGPDPEFPFVVKVPDSAMVSGLSLTRDGVTTVAEVKERQAARAQYEATKAREATGGLVEKQRGSSTYRYLVNVAAFESVTAELTYEDYLVAQNGTYTLELEAPVSGFGQDLGASFDVHLAAGATPLANTWTAPNLAPQSDGEGGQRYTWSVGPRSAEAATRLSLHYVPTDTGNAGAITAVRTDHGGFFLHRFQARVDVPTVPVDMVLVLDTSGSMAGQKILQLRDAAHQVIQALGPQDRVHLIPFSGATDEPWAGMLATDGHGKDQALAEVDSLVASGATGIESALAAARRSVPAASAEEARHAMPVVVFLTDGQATVGATDAATLRAQAAGIRTAGARLFAIAFGGDADWRLVAGLAADGGGNAVQVAGGTGAEADLGRFMTLLTAPVLREVQLDYAPGIHAVRPGAPVLYAGSELLVVGTFDAAVDRIAGTMRAKGPDGNVTASFDHAVAPSADGATARMLERLVAYATIRRDQAQLASGPNAELAAEALALALKYGFVTDQTSLVLSLDAPPASAQPTASRQASGGMAAPGATSGAAAAAASATAAASTAPNDLVFNEAQDSDGDGQLDSWGGASGAASSTSATTPAAPVGVLALAALGATLVAMRRRRA